MKIEFWVVIGLSSFPIKRKWIPKDKKKKEQLIYSFLIVGVIFFHAQANWATDQQRKYLKYEYKCTIRISKRSPFVLIICFVVNFFFFLLVWFGLVLFLLQYKTWVNNHEKRFSFDLGIVSHNHDINKGNKDVIWSVNERMETWYSSANTWESYRIGTKKNPFDIIPINSTEITQNRLVPS